MKAQRLQQTQRALRRQRVRARMHGTAEAPRLSVFRSLQHTYAQLIDDVHGVTLAHAWDGEVEKTTTKETATTKRLNTARQVGALLAERAKAKKIMKVIFDRGSAAYHGRVAAVAEGAREGGLQF